MQKRGLSSVVSTVLIILLVVVAVAIIGVIVLNTADKTSVSIGSSSLCQDATIEPSKCNYNDTNIFGVFSVKLKNNANIEGLTFSITKNDSNTISSFVSGSSLQTLNTYSFLLDSTNTASVPLKLSSVIKVKDSKGNSKICQSVNTITCFPPLLVSGQTQNPGQTPITANNTTLSFVGNASNLTISIKGCTNASATNYNNLSNYNDGSCVFNIITWNQIDSCRDITVPGNYRLNQSIFNIAGNCFNITSNDIVFDGAGYTIKGINPSLFFSGINLTGRSNVIIANLTIDSFRYGINSAASSNNVFYNINSISNYMGVYLWAQSNNNRLLNITFSNVFSRTSHQGLVISDNSNNNQISKINSSNLDWGIWGSSSSNNNFSEIAVSTNNRGVYLANVNNITFYNLNSTKNYNRGINIVLSNNLSFYSMNVSDNLGDGVLIDSSSNISLNGIVKGNSYDDLACTGTIYPIFNNSLTYLVNYNNQCIFI